MNRKKKLNKILIGTFLGTALGSIGIFFRTKKGKRFFSTIKKDIKNGLAEMKLSFENLKNKYVKKKK